MKYYVTRNDEEEQEVTREQFIEAEVEAGFRIWDNESPNPVTGGFIKDDLRDTKIKGRIDREA